MEPVQARTMLQTAVARPHVFWSPSASTFSGTKRSAPPSPSHSPTPKKFKDDLTQLQCSVLTEQLIYYRHKNGTIQASHNAEKSEMRSKIEQLETVIVTMQCQINRLQDACGLNGQQGTQNASFLDQLMYDEGSGNVYATNETSQ